jgi:hypothetical protein
MVKQFLKIAGVKNEQEFYKKYPTEAAFFKAHPEAKTLAKMAQGGYINKALPFVPHSPVMYAQGGGLPMFQQKGKYDGDQSQDDMDQYISSLGKGAPQMVGPQQPFIAPKPNYGAVGPKQQFGMVGPHQSYGMVGPHIPLPPYTPEPENYQEEPDYGMTGPVQQFGMIGPHRPASTYGGTSVVDYLKSRGESSDKESRRKLAESKGIKNYTGDYNQNIALLKALRDSEGAVQQYPRITKQKAKAPAVVTSKKSMPQKATPDSEYGQVYDMSEEEFKKWNALNPSLFTQGEFDYGNKPEDAFKSKLYGSNAPDYQFQRLRDEQNEADVRKYYSDRRSHNITRFARYADGTSYAGYFDPQDQNPNLYLPPTNKSITEWNTKKYKNGGQPLNNRAEINNIYAQGGEAPDSRALINKDSYGSRGIVNSYAQGGGYPYIGIPYHNYDMPMAYAYGGMYQMGGAPQQVDGQAQQSQGGGGQDQQIAQVVMQRLQEQEQPEQILKDLVKAGVDDKKAVAIVQAVMQQMQQAGGGQQQAQQMQMARYGGAMYQKGGYVAGQEYDLDDEEIQRLKSLGYGVEYRD